MAHPRSKPTDEIFSDEVDLIDDFEFGERVVSVFDDMVSRSVPFYSEIQRMIGDLSSDFAAEGSNVVDLGCSTGTTFLALDPLLPESVGFVGIDDSKEMLRSCAAKLAEAGVSRSVELVNADLNRGVMLDNASVAILCLTLQFVRPLNRVKLLRSIHDQLRPDGCLLLVEKVLGEDSLLNRLFIRHYYELKRRHRYSELEISQKREALENVLIPYKLSENMEMLAELGFRQVEVFFKWYNFSAIVAVK